MNEVDDLALRILNQGVAGQVAGESRRLYIRLGNGNRALMHDLLVIAVTLASFFLLSQLPPAVLARGSYDLRSLNVMFIVIPAYDLWISARSYLLKRHWLKVSDKEIIDWLKKKGREIKTTGKRAPWPPPYKG